MTRKTLTAFIVTVLILAGAGYYFFIYSPHTSLISSTPPDTTNNGGFSPFDRNNVTPPSQTQTTQNSTSTPRTVVNQSPQAIPTLRELSSTPIGGAAASSTKSGDTVFRFINRGTGHVSEALGTTLDINKVSNTTIPRVYTSYWNKNLNAMVLQYLKSGSDTIVNFYTEIQPIKNQGTSTNTTLYELKGKFMSPGIQEIAVSPSKNQIFTFNNEGGRGIGYISNFDESKKVKILDIPATQMNVEWPNENFVTLTTKGSGVSSGFLYSVDVKSGVMKKIFGDVVGLSAKVSPDMKKVLFSSYRDGGIATSLFNVKDGTFQDVIFKTLADKCVWSTIRPSEVYCAVPREIPQGTYPDQWYKGNVQFVDQIWHLDTSTGEVHLLANLTSISKTLIDATNLTLDPKENYLFFTNKNDLSLWSLDLNQ